MNTLKNINAALVTAYKALGLDLPTAYEARDFSPPASAPWARVLNVPADKFVRSLGDSGQDNVTGFFQMDFFVPENTGTAGLHGYADTALDYFKNGRRFTYGGQGVKVRRSSLTPIRRDQSSASYGITISVFWDSPTSR